MKKIMFTSLFIFLTISMYCQEERVDAIKYKINNSTVYGGLGVTPLYGNVTANYEIMLVERPDKTFKKRGLRAGAGI